MREPLPAHKRAEILVRVAGLLGRRHDEVARTISAEAGKPLKAAKVEAARAMSTFTMAAVEARKLAGEMVPMDASQAGEGKLAFTLRLPIGVVGAISPVQLPAQSRRPQDRAGARRRLRGRAEAGVADAALRAPARRARDEAGLPPGWLNVARRPGVRDRRRARRGRARASDHVHRLERGRLEARRRAPRKRVKLELGNATPVIVEADADLDDAAAKLAANAFSFAGQSCISVQRIYVQQLVVRRLPRRASCPRSRRSSSATRRTRPPMSAP